MQRTITLAAALVLGTSTLAAAQPAADKGDAKALMASGLRLFQAKDYLGALSVFKDAYARFPSPKILLNIGTTLRQLGRNAEAANTYQRYLDDPEADPAKRAEVVRVLATLDATVGTLEITATPETTQLQINGDERIAARTASQLRVTPGSVTISATATGYTPLAKTVDVAAGGKLAVALELTAVPTPAVTTTDTDTTTVDDGIETSTTAEPTSKLGAFAYAHVDIQFEGAAAYVGISYTIIPRLRAEAGPILGPTFGGYAGARYQILGGMLRPVVAAGVPVFFSDGARVGVRGAGGLEVMLHRRLAAVAEVGVEHVFNAEPMRAATLFVPSVGVAGWL